MSDLQVKRLNGGKAFPARSKPPSLVHQFLDENDDPYDLSVGIWAGQGRAEQLHVALQPADIGTGSVSIDIAQAKATYNWHSSDFATPGIFRIIIWIGNGTQRFGSTVYEWEVVDAPGADPSV